MQVRPALLLSRIALGVALFGALQGCVLLWEPPPEPAPPPPPATDRGWWTGNPALLTTPAVFFEGKERKSWYVPMRDGVRLAVDVWLPAGLPAGIRLPAILEQTRYYRSSVMRADPAGRCRPAGEPTIDLFVARGYAWVIVDVRGTGASFGVREIEYSDEEVRDSGEIVDWIVAQTWSNAVIGATGNSYAGTTAEMLLRNGRTAVKAVMPMFSGYDFYGEIVRPGGIHNTAFTTAWADANRVLDAGEGSPAVRGPCPVDRDTGGTLLKQAIAEHAGSYNLVSLLEHVPMRDDRWYGASADAVSPYRFREEMDRAQVPVYGVSGWNDSGYAAGAIRRFVNSKAPGARLLLGPWNHGARFYYAPGVRQPTPSVFPLAVEKLRFFDYALKGVDAGFSTAPPVRYFTTGINQWRGAQQWPPSPAKMLKLSLAAGGALSGVAPADAGVDEYASDGDESSGEFNRWRSTHGPHPVAYADRATVDEKLLAYTTSPLAADTEVTGTPALTLYAAIDREDGDFFVYLEEVMADGQVNYVSEGQLRASHRKPGALPYRSDGPTHTGYRKDLVPVTPGQPMRLDIALWPLSHVFRQGSRIRVSLASADRSQFTERPVEPARWRVFRGGPRPSRIELPVAK